MGMRAWEWTWYEIVIIVGISIAFCQLTNTDIKTHTHKRFTSLYPLVRWERSATLKPAVLLVKIALDI